MHDPIAIELDDEGKWIVFRRTQREQRGDFARGLLELPPRFTLADVYEAALATGLVISRNRELFCSATTGCNALARYTDEMLGYFDRPGRPGTRLKRILRQLDDHFELEEALEPVRVAWLDVILREDIADAARSEVDPWGTDRLVIELERLRDRRIREAVEAQRQSATGAEYKLAKSQRTRSSQKRRKSSGERGA
jgi:hypothetical protein